MCHDAVMEWLQASGYVANGIHTSIFGLGDRSAVYATILVNSNDTRITTMDQLNQLTGGMIIGFWSDNKLQHSIITLGDRILAGANNAGIFAIPDEGKDFPKIHNNLFSIFLTSQIAWDAGSRTVGGSNYTMHYASPDVIAGRINGAAG